MEHQGDGNRERGGNACDTAGTPAHLPSNRKPGALLFLLLPPCPMKNAIVSIPVFLIGLLLFQPAKLEDTEGELLVASEKR